MSEPGLVDALRDELRRERIPVLHFRKEDGETLDQRSDLFSFGSVLYTMCTGDLPFKASKTLGVLKRVCDDAPRPISDLNADELEEFGRKFEAAQHSS